MAMRVTDSTLYRKYTTAVNDVHSKLNKSMNKIATGAAYETAADNPLAYYSGKRMDNMYQDILGKQDLLEDVKNRLHQQELGARSIQSTLATDAKGGNVLTQISYILNSTNNEISTTVGTVRDDLIQKQQSMIDDLNTQYQNYFVYGGNDLSTTPFKLDYNPDGDGMLLTYSHKFSGDTTTTEFTFKLEEDPAGGFTFKLQNPAADPDLGDKLIAAMSEQGNMDVGYGNVHDTNTLIDTYTGGLNVLTGYTSDVMKKGGVSVADIEKALGNSAVGLTGQAIDTLDKYIKFLDNDRTPAIGNIDKDEFSKQLNSILDEIDVSSSKLSSIYSDLGSKYNQLEKTADRLSDEKIALETQYKEVLGADPYEAIIEMFSHQRSYQASLQVSANLMNMSLFSYMR